MVKVETMHKLKEIVSYQLMTIGGVLSTQTLLVVQQE
jgi:hypothetical protein